MQEHQLKELAYTMFFGACGKRSNAELIQVMRAQLEVGLKPKYSSALEPQTFAVHTCRGASGQQSSSHLICCP